MLKALLILLPASLLAYCDAKRPAPAARADGASQPSRQTPEPGKKGCDFSDFKPAKARANYGSPVKSKPQPRYPPEAKARGVQGRVLVLLLVNVRSGLVEQACVIEGDEALAQAAREAAFQVRFDPYGSHIRDRHTHAEELVAYQFVTP